MSTQSSLQSMRDHVRSIASELVVLADSYEPNPSVAMGIETAFVKKAKSLVSTAQTTNDYSLSLIASSMETSVVQTLYSINALQSIPPTGSITLQDLSTATNADEGFLARLLRVLVGSGFIKQDDEDAYSHTPRSVGFSKGAHAGELFDFLYTAGVEVLARLPEYLQEKKQAHPQGRYCEPGGNNGATHNPSTWRYGQEGKTVFEIFSTMPAKAMQMQKMMASVALINPFTGFYDFSRLTSDPSIEPSEPTRPTLVDVGGGHGDALTHILAAYPTLRPEQCILQDLPNVLATARTGNPALPSGVQLHPHDYFTAQPVRGARAYHLRAVAHDLGDADLVRVLRATAAAMAPDSRVLIADNLLPARGTAGLSGIMDMTMLLIAGKERTERDFRKVCKAAGLRVVGVHRVGGEHTYAMVEARLE